MVRFSSANQVAMVPRVVGGRFSSGYLQNLIPSAIPRLYIVDGITDIYNLHLLSSWWEDVVSVCRCFCLLLLGSLGYER